MTDHLGNNWVVADQSGIAIQKNHYYLFGMTFTESMDLDTQPYKYNGKELDRELGLNLYDYSARQMDNAVPRFTSIDPMAEKKPWLSLYVYCFNNQ
ncbi:MAG: RHS repeat-associated core domain-containing protein [Dysgonomonas sp.]